MKTPESGIAYRSDWRFRRRGAISAVVLVPVGILVAISDPTVSEESLPGIVLEAMAWASFVAGLVLRFWSTLYIGGRKLSTLVSVGPYSMCRNPLYLGSFLIALSCGLILKHLTLAAGIAIASYFYMRLTIPEEERAIRNRHGEAYESYCRRVNRIWPRMSNFRTPDFVDVSTKGLGIEFRRCLVWIWLPFVCQLLVYLRTKPWWPVYLHLW